MGIERTDIVGIQLAELNIGNSYGKTEIDIGDRGVHDLLMSPCFDEKCALCRNERSGLAMDKDAVVVKDDDPLIGKKASRKAPLYSLHLIFTDTDGGNLLEIHEIVSDVFLEVLGSLIFVKASDKRGNDRFAGGIFHEFFVVPVVNEPVVIYGLVTYLLLCCLVERELTAAIRADESFSIGRKHKLAGAVGTFIQFHLKTTFP